MLPWTDFQLQFDGEGLILGGYTGRKFIPALRITSAGVERLESAKGLGIKTNGIGQLKLVGKERK